MKEVNLSWKSGIGKQKMVNSKIGVYKSGGLFGFGSSKIGDVAEVKEERLRAFLEKLYGKPIKIWT